MESSNTPGTKKGSLGFFWLSQSCPLTLLLSTGGTVLALGVGLGMYFHVHLVLSGSVPPGLYRPVSRPIAKGEYVVACVPQPFAELGVERGYLEEGSCPGNSAPVIKRVVATAGDEVEVGPNRIVVREVENPNFALYYLNTEIHELDSHGRRMPHIHFGTYRVQEDEVWLISTYHPLSWDSRYWGAVNTRDIQTVAEEVLTW